MKDMPEDLRKLLGGSPDIPTGLPPGMDAVLASLLGDIIAGGGKRPGRGVAQHPLLKAKEPPFHPASKQEFLDFINGAPKEPLKVGDIVIGRPGYFNDLWPKIGQQAIVSQVLTVPMRTGKLGTAEAGRYQDVALMFFENDDSEIDEAFGDKTTRPPEMAEFLYDSRKLTRVGSVYDTGSV